VEWRLDGIGWRLPGDALLARTARALALAARIEAEAGEVLGVSRTKVTSCFRVGKIESVRIDGARHIPSDALMAYVEHLRVEASGYEAY
jgi:hypothetical protein